MDTAAVAYIALLASIAVALVLGEAAPAAVGAGYQMYKCNFI